MGNYSKTDCVHMLALKYEELKASGENRYPAQKDFTAEEITAVKAFLGPWPRALEKAGIKECNPERERKKLEKRINQRRKKTQRKIEKNNSAGLK